MSRRQRSCLWLLVGLAAGSGLAVVALALLLLLTSGSLAFLGPDATIPAPDASVVATTPAGSPFPENRNTPAPGSATLLPPTASATTGATGTPGLSSPTGRIVFTCFVGGFDQICSVNADGSDPRRLTTASATEFYPEWGPLGNLITFSSRRSGAFQIYLMNADGSDQRLVSPGLDNLYAPDISPDGNRIAFTRASGDEQHIWVMNVDGSETRALTGGPHNDLDPVWSPDGQQIAFASDRGARPGHWLMSADGSNMRRLPDDVAEHGGRSDWSPDGQWLAFYAGPRDDRDIYLVATDGSGTTRRLTDGGRNLAPSYAPDGNWIAFTSYRTGDDAEIWIMRPDGSDPRQVTFNDRPDWQPRWSPR